MKKRRLREDIELAIEEEFARLNQEFVKFKRAGVIPKGEKFKVSDLRAVAMIIGVPAIKLLPYLEFQKKLAEIRNKF